MFVAYRFEVDMVEGLHKQRALETRLLKHLLESDIILPLLVGIQHRDFLGQASRGFTFFPFAFVSTQYVTFLFNIITLGRQTKPPPFLLPIIFESGPSGPADVSNRKYQRLILLFAYTS